eukprot:SAG22_NODE_719_length_7666_cov_5.819083_4_plen_92_part_00
MPVGPELKLLQAVGLNVAVNAAVKLAAEHSAIAQDRPRLFKACCLLCQVLGLCTLVRSMGPSPWDSAAVPGQVDSIARYMPMLQKLKSRQA